MIRKKMFSKPDIFPQSENVVLFLQVAGKTPTHVHSEEFTIYQTIQG